MRTEGGVLRAVISYRYTWLVAAILVGAEWVFSEWFEPPATMDAVSFGVAGGLLLLWPFLLIRSSPFIEHMYRLPGRIQAADSLELDGLAAELEKVGSTQGLEQLSLLGRKLETVREVLKQRLSSGELTFARYIGVAEQVYLNAIDNLKEIHVALTSVSTIDRDYIDKRLIELRADTSRARVKERGSLEVRRSLLEEQLEKVAHLTADNEEMMTALDNTATALANAKIRRGRARMDAEAAMSELIRLAASARDYE